MPSGLLCAPDFPLHDVGVVRQIPMNAQPSVHEVS
jgi:hypothetical protein